MRSLVALAILLCFGCAPERAPAPEKRSRAESSGGSDVPLCHADFAKLLADDVFADYAAPVQAGLSEPAQPDVRTGKPHLYRSVIRAEARNGPNFAGHYTIISIGCGAASTCLAIADAVSGKVFFPENLEGVGDLMVLVDRHSERLNFRRDSRLLVVRGAPNFDLKRLGLSYFEWRDDRLRLVRHIPAGELCGLSQKEQYWLRTPS